MINIEKGSNFTKLKRSFYSRNTILVAIDLIGKILYYRTDQGIFKGQVVEVEAYLGDKDPACHAFVGKTQRSKIFWDKPGLAYIFVIYGIYHCLNAITEEPNIPGCVLIRALEPLQGIDTMKRNRNINDLISLTNGPGKLTQAYGITREQNGMDMIESNLCFFNNSSYDEINVTSRIGISKAISEPLRFYVHKNPFVSRSNRKPKKFYKGSPKEIIDAFQDGTLKVNL